MEDPPEQVFTFIQTVLLAGLMPWDLILGLVVMVLLLACSAMISGAEVAYFSLSKSDTEELAESPLRIRKQAIALLKRPKKLLATILIANNFVNVGIVILTTYLIAQNVPKETLNYLLGGVVPIARVIEVFGITFMVLLFGEIIPKVYANQYAVAFASIMSFPLHYLNVIFSFLSVPLMKLALVIDRLGTAANAQISVDELSHALDLTKAESVREKEDRKILEGIVKFGLTDVKQIMKPRTDVEAIEVTCGYEELMSSILESGFSRVPVYEESLDNIVGIIHVKDLLAHMDKGDDFNWRQLMRPPFFVPESKMIDDLLEEFRHKKVHLAIVVDEYGGCEGLVTLEDIIEQIVGDISDEFDDEELAYSKLDEDNYVFEGKTNLKQFYRALKIDGGDFEKHKGEADTLAGFILELAGKMPYKNDRIPFASFEFTIESVDKRRIKRIKVTRLPKQQSNEGHVTLTLSLLLLVSLGFSACEQVYTPKPRGYIRIDLPERGYAPLETECPYQFEFDTCAKFAPDLRLGSDPCWFNLEYPQFKAKIYFSYKAINDNLVEYLEDSRELTNKHISKASGIEEILISNPAAHVYGTLYTVDGSQAASPLQFHLTDSTDHFLRAALYFNVAPNNDSLAPVIDFIREDIMHLINSFEWKESSRSQS